MTETTQRPTPVSVNNTVATQDQPQELLPDNGTARRLASLHPKYQRANPYGFRAKFLNDSKFRTQYIDEVFALGLQEDPELAAEFAENPDIAQQTKNNMLSNFTRDLYRDASSGEEIQDAIINRASDLYNFQKPSVSTLQQVVQSFPDNYKSFGLTDGKKPGDLLKDTSAFQHLVDTDTELRKQIYTDRYNLFTQALSQAHNVHGVNLSNADDLAKAYAVYENYGSEGLTKYVNYRQNYIPGVDISEQPRDVLEAKRFFETTDYAGRNPQDVINGFIGSPDSEQGQLTYTPKQKSLELELNTPLDRNAFTVGFQTKELNQGATEVFNTAQGKAYFTPDKVQTVLASIDNGIPNDDANSVLFDIMAKARNNEGWSMQDLISTVATNAQGVQIGDDGVTRYVINPEELNTYSKIAMEALRMDATYGYKMFSPGENGTLLFEPERQERLQTTQDISGQPFFRRVDRVRKAVFDDSGTIIGYDEQFDDGFGNTVASMLGRSGQFMADYIFTPLADATAKTFEVIGQPEVAENITSSDFYRNIREYADFDPYQETDSFAGKASLMGTDLGMYLLGAYTLGAAAVGVAGGAAGVGAVSAASKLYSARTGALAARFLNNPVTPTLTQARATKFLNLTHKNWGGLGTAFKLETGAAGMEAIGGQQRSLFANPLIDSVFDTIGVQTDVEKAYMTSDNITRMGIDILGSVGIGIAADNILAGIRFGANAMRKVPTQGVKLKPNAKGVLEYERVASPEFAPDWRRLWVNSMNGVQDLPIGNLVESKANLFLGKELARNPGNIETLSDAMAVMNNNYSEFFTGIRDDLEKSVRHWDEKFGGSIRYSEDQLQARIDGLEQELYDNIADGIVTIFREQDPNKTDLISVMIGAMEQAGNAFKSLPYVADDTFKTLMNADEANAVKLQYPNSFIVPVEQADGSIKYGVQQADPGFWGVRLAESVRRRNMVLSFDEVVDKEYRRLGFDPDKPTPESIQVTRQFAERVHKSLGQEVIYNNERGYITDLVGENYTIRTVDGNIYENVQFRQSDFEMPEIMQLSTQVQRPDAVQQVAALQAREGMRRLATEADDMLGQLRPQRLLPQGTPSVTDDEVVQSLRQSFTGQANADQILADIDSGVPFDSILGRMRQLGVPESQVRDIMNEGIEKKIAARQRGIQRVLNDSTSPENKQMRIAELQEEIDVLRASQSDYDARLSQVYRTEGTKIEADNAVIARQTEEALGGDPIKTLAQRWDRSSNKARQGANEARLVSGKRQQVIRPGGTDPVREAFGLGRGLMNQLVEGTKGRLTLSRNAARNALLSLGADTNLIDDISKLAYNKGTIKPFEYGKDVKKNTLVVDRGLAFVSRANIKKAGEEIKDTLPSTWIYGMDGRLHLNPYWAAVEANHTLNLVTGQLNRFVKVGQGTFGPVYRPAKVTDPFENQVYLNVQRPTNKLPKDQDQIFTTDVDAVVTRRGAETHYEIFNEGDQAIAVNRVDAFDGSMKAKREDLIKMRNCR